MTLKIEPLLDRMFRFFIGGIFIWASLGKIIDPAGFAVIVKNYQILPLFLINPVAVILPWLELLCGVLLVSGVWVRGSIVLIDMLLIIFIVSFMVNLIRGIDVNCGCFSTSPTLKGNTIGYLMRDLVILMMGVWVLKFQLNHTRKKPT